MHWAVRPALAAHAGAGSTAVLGVAATRDLRQLRARYGFRIVRSIPQLHAAVVVVSPRLAAATDPRIRYLSPTSAESHLDAMPNDPLLQAIDPRTSLPFEWQFAAARVDRALDLSPGSPTTVVGTIDTGAADIPDLRGKVDQRWTVSQAGKLRRDTRAYDNTGHGTAVASLIAANTGDGFGMAGFGGATHVIAIRAWPLKDSSVAIALMKLDALGVRIVNMSFGRDTQMGPVLLDAIHKATNDGLLLVAATGNSAAPVAYPAADLQAPGGQESLGLAIGASTVDGGPADFSNSGDNLSLVAPGTYRGSCTGVLLALPPLSDLSTSCSPTWSGDGGAVYAYGAGTSFAAPEVAGIAALIWAARPSLKNYQVADIIKQSARRGSSWTPTSGCGVLDAGAALELATSYSSAQWSGASGAAAPCSAGT
jgi:thermitase